jgi:large subunit ribosomal protein L5
MSYTPTLKKLYFEKVQGNLQKEYGYKSKMQVPRIEKIVINQGIGKAVADKKLIETAVNELSLIAGQKAIPTYSKKDIQISNYVKECQ